jgi:hypothetical protein
VLSLGRGLLRCLFLDQVAFDVDLDLVAHDELAVRHHFELHAEVLAVDQALRRVIEAGELRAGTNPGRLVDLLMGTISMPLLFFQELPAVDEAAAIVDQVLSGFGVHNHLSDHPI